MKKKVVTVSLLDLLPLLKMSLQWYASVKEYLGLPRTTEVLPSGNMVEHHVEKRHSLNLL